MVIESNSSLVLSIILSLLALVRIFASSSLLHQQFYLYIWYIELKSFQENSPINILQKSLGTLKNDFLYSSYVPGFIFNFSRDSKSKANTFKKVQFPPAKLFTDERWNTWKKKCTRLFDFLAFLWLQCLSFLKFIFNFQRFLLTLSLSFSYFIFVDYLTFFDFLGSVQDFFRECTRLFWVFHRFFTDT